MFSWNLTVFVFSVKLETYLYIYIFLAERSDLTDVVPWFYCDIYRYRLIRINLFGDEIFRIVRLYFRFKNRIHVVFPARRNAPPVTTETPSACSWGSVFPVTATGIRTSVWTAPASAWWGSFKLQLLVEMSWNLSRVSLLIRTVSTTPLGTSVRNAGGASWVTTVWMGRRWRAPAAPALWGRRPTSKGFHVFLILFASCWRSAP